MMDSTTNNNNNIISFIPSTSSSYSSSFSSSERSQQQADNIHGNNITSLWSTSSVAGGILSSYVNESAATLTISSTSITTTTTPEGLKCAGDYQFYTWNSVIILGFIAFPVNMFGLCSNLMSIRIYTHQIMRRSSINWYLAILSTSDFTTIFCSFCMHCLPRLSEYFRLFVGYRVSLYMIPIIYPLATLSQTISVYMTILMSAHRFVGVCFPFRAGGILTTGRVKFAIGALLCLSVLFNSTRPFEVRVVGECYAAEIQDWSVVLALTALRANPVYQWIFLGLGQTIFMFCVPFVSLIILNTQILLAIQRTRRQHASIHSGGDGGGQSKRAEAMKEMSTSIMLVTVVLAFLFCNSLSFVVNIIECAGYIDRVGFSRFNMMVGLSNLLVNLNASINIAVYCLFSDKFRMLLFHYASCRCWFTKHRGALLLATTEY